MAATSAKTEPRNVEIYTPDTSKEQSELYNTMLAEFYNNTPGLKVPKNINLAPEGIERKIMLTTKVPMGTGDNVTTKKKVLAVIHAKESSEYPSLLEDIDEEGVYYSGNQSITNNNIRSQPVYNQVSEFSKILSIQWVDSHDQDELGLEKRTDVDLLRRISTGTASRKYDLIEIDPLEIERKIRDYTRFAFKDTGITLAMGQDRLPVYAKAISK